MQEVSVLQAIKKDGVVAAWLRCTSSAICLSLLMHRLTELRVSSGFPEVWME